MSAELVSVVVPTYNQSRYLMEAVASALAQTHQALEVIVIDDGSTDDTATACAAISDPRLRYVRQANDGTRGIGARNAGLMLARGEWIALLDHDDRWHANKLEQQLLAARDRGADLVFCPVRFIDEHGAVTREQAAGELPSGDVFHPLLARNRYFVSSGLFRRRLLSLAGLPHESCGLADWTLWLGLARHAQVAVVPEVLADYREHTQGYQASLLARNRLRFADDQWRTLLGQRNRLHPGCAQCLRIYRQGMAGVAQLYLRSARRSLAARHYAGVWPALQGAWVAAPGRLLQPWVAALELVRLAATALIGAVAPRSSHR